jgi:MoxR-like ATPase
MMRLSLGYPDRDAELDILQENPSERAFSTLTPVITASDFLKAQSQAAAVFCHEKIKETIADIVRDTRIHQGFTLGASPRAGLHFLAACRALAFVRNREYITDEDIAALCVPILAHRLKTRDQQGNMEKNVRDICMARLALLKNE